MDDATLKAVVRRYQDMLSSGQIPDDCSDVERTVATFKSNIDLELRATINRVHKLTERLNEWTRLSANLKRQLIKTLKRTYEARRKEASDATSDPHVRMLVFYRDGWKCKECGTTEDLTVDHVVSVIAGGSDELGNFQALCRPCNSRKGGGERGGDFPGKINAGVLAFTEEDEVKAHAILRLARHYGCTVLKKNSPRSESQVTPEFVVWFKSNPGADLGVVLERAIRFNMAKKFLKLTNRAA